MFKPRTSHNRRLTTSQARTRTEPAIWSADATEPHTRFHRAINPLPCSAGDANTANTALMPGFGKMKIVRCMTWLENLVSGSNGSSGRRKQLHEKSVRKLNDRLADSQHLEERRTNTTIQEDTNDEYAHENSRT